MSEMNPLSDVLRAVLGWNREQADLDHTLLTTLGFIGAFIGTLSGGFIVYNI